jgi:hypothetical protein
MPRRVASGILAPGEVMILCMRAFCRALALILASTLQCRKDRGKRQARRGSGPYAPSRTLTLLDGTMSQAVLGIRDSLRDPDLVPRTGRGSLDLASGPARPPRRPETGRGRAEWPQEPPGEGLAAIWTLASIATRRRPESSLSQQKTGLLFASGPPPCYCSAQFDDALPRDPVRSRAW